MKFNSTFKVYNLSILLLSYGLFTPVFSQNISGVINTYFEVTAINGANITVNNAIGLNVGDSVLVIQMQGANIMTTNNVNFGNITNYNSAGFYEFNSISAINGNIVTLAYPLCNTYQIAGNVQLISMPVYTNPTIVGTLTCQAWNGTTGGVLALIATGTVTFNANIDISALGFRGGVHGYSVFNYNDNAYATNYPQGGEKGEAIAIVPANQDANRGKVANGGGGSSRRDCGGGGGGNAGAGGRGGNAYSGTQNPGNNFGVGGVALALASNRAFMGGGGGGGREDNNQTVTDGGNGGGIVFILANQIAGNNQNINNNGEDVIIVSNDEGAGAGGAGGAVHIWCNTISSQLTINVNGGFGGDIYNNIFATQTHGPGGGGGGGYAYFSQANLSPNVDVYANGGASGMVLHPGQYYNTPWGAQNGNPGDTLFNIPFPTPPKPVPNLGHDTAICVGNNILLDAGPNYTGYLWSDGSTNQTLLADTGLYWVEVPVGCITAFRDSILISPIIVSPNLGNDTSICPTDSLILSPGTYSSYLWSDGSQNPTLTVFAADTYYVAVTDANGCIGYDTLVLSVFPYIVPNIGQDTAFCLGDSVVFDATNAAFSSYLWQSGGTNATYTATQQGAYFVTITDTNGCTATDTAHVTQIYALPQPSLGSDTTICPEDSLTLNPGAFATYLWQNGTANQTYVVNNSGVFWVEVTNANGCLAVDSITVSVFNTNSPYLGNDISLCANDTVTFSPQGNFVSYVWQDGSMQSTYTTSQAGIYYVSATDANGCVTTDTVAVLNVFPLPQPQLGQDTSFCQGETINLLPGSFAAYQWKNGAASQQIQVNATGTFIVEVTDVNGCKNADTLIVQNVYALPVFSLGADIKICPGFAKTLTPSPTSFANYIWNDGSVGSTLTIIKDGIYWLSVTNNFGCVYSDTLRAILKCPVSFYVPNSFTPNDDNLNDIFKAKGEYISRVKMEIYNRWGERIYYGETMKDGWNGYHKNKICPMGTYVYKITYLTVNSAEPISVLGHVNLIR